MIPLPPEFLRALQGHEEVLVTSREEARHGTVPVWFVVAPPGVLYLFGMAYSLKAQRWKKDPWVRLSVPGTRLTVEGRAQFVEGAAIDAVAPLIVDRWLLEGATTVEGLRRAIRDGSHVLVRVEGAPGAA